MTEAFDMGLLRGLITALLLVAFCGMVLWAYSKRRKDDFSEAAAMPLDDDNELDEPLPLTDWEIEGEQQ
ncbi:MAG: cbb3-type cytochrome oxidase subunit 3 [Lysobacterales bacterium]